MNLKIQQTKTHAILGCLLISCFVIIITFPETYGPYKKGMDESLVWVFNYLFKNNLQLGKHIIFPHGPLAFFMYPSVENVLLTTLVTAALKILLVFNLFQLLLKGPGKFIWPVTFIISYGFSVVASFQQLILIDILLLYCNFFHSGKLAYKILAFFLTAFGMYVRAYVAIISFVLFISFISYYFYSSKKLKPFLKDCIALIIFIASFWIFLYGTLDGLPDYLFGLVQLAQDNSSAVAYYPYNNWFLLGSFFALLITIFIINRAKKTGFYVTLISLSVFAAWKHGIAREDMPHTWIFLIYVGACLTIFILFIKNKIYLNTTLAIITLFCFVLNLRFIYSPWRPELNRSSYFIQLISDFPKFKQQAEIASQKNSASNLLPAPIRTIIADATADSYPWDYSIIAVNQLNWQPRVTIQSYASYTSWLDSMNAAHFNSTHAPEYLIWQLDKLTYGLNAEEFSSLDHRYLLNDEPQTMIQLLKNYDFFFQDKRFLILKKRKAASSTVHKIIGTTETSWSKWIPVPRSDEHLLRAKLNFDRTITERIKSFLYKDEQFWIYLKLKNGLIHKYRIVPKNAADGLWINPYIYNIDKAYDVEEVMFKCSSQDMLVNKLTVTWESLHFNGENNRALAFFKNPKKVNDSIIYSSGNLFEKDSILPAHSYSPAISLSLDDVSFQNIQFVAGCWAKTPHYKFTNNLSLAFVISDSTKIIAKRDFPIETQLIDTDQWNNISYFINYSHHSPNCKFTLSIKNASDDDVLIHDLRVTIIKNE